jgi:hypothetical protein
MPYGDEARCHSAHHSVTPFVAVICLTPVPLLRMTESSWFSGTYTLTVDPQPAGTGGLAVVLQ